MLLEHHPFVDARIFKKEATSLLRKGYDVTIVAPKRAGFLFDVNGMPFKDRFLKPTFIHEGIKIVTYDPGVTKYEPDQLAAAILSGKPDLFVDPLTKAGIAVDADIYHAHEYMSLYSGVGIKRALRTKKGKKVKLIYDSHELTPDINDVNRKVYQSLLDRMIKETDYILTVSEGIKAWYLIRNPLLPIEVIYNTPPLAQNYKPKNYNKSNLTVCYEGIVHDSRGSINKICEITDYCSKDIDFKFKVVGGYKGRQALTLPATLQGRVILSGWVPYRLLPKLLADVDIGWIDFELPSLNHSFALPNKFFSYLNNGIPVLVNRCSELEYMIREFHCGLVIDKLNPTSSDYAKALLYLHKHRDLLKNMSTNARKMMKQVYSWENMEKRLFNVYGKL